MRTIFALLLVALPLAAAPARAAPPVVDVELVLAVDVSWSMDADEQLLQRAGYAAAFRHPAVIAAIAKGDWGRIAVTYVEWAGVGLERTLVPWTIVGDAASAQAFAGALAAAPVGRMRRTSISSALAHAAGLFDNGIDGLKRVIDVSGDGPNNMGGLVTAARDRVLAQGITINGLPIMIKRSNPGGYFNLDALDIYYEDCVIGGWGAFMITVNDAARFPEAIRRKLILEIAAAPAAVIAAAAHRAEPRIDCTIGEQQWRRWQRLDPR